ncbi:MAG: PorP/SprF family type IX secretion system membrane protein [Bacteroidota bacterium]
MRRSLFTLLLATLLMPIPRDLLAQDPHTSFVGVAPSIYNPALTGVINDARTRVAVNSRLQWDPVVGRDDSFRTYNLAVDSYVCLPWDGDVLAWGVFATSDRRGASPLYRFDGNLALAYRKRLDENNKRTNYLSLGGKLGVIQHRIDYGNLTFNEQFDNPSLPPEVSGLNTSTVADLSVGVAFSSLSKRRLGQSWEAGFSILHVNRPFFSLIETPVDERLGQFINLHFVGHGSILMPINNQALRISLIYRRQAPHEQLLASVDFHFELARDNYLFIGTGYRFSEVSAFKWDARIFNLGFLLSEQYSITFHYDWGTYVRESVPQSLEASISYRFGSTSCQRVYCPNY